MVTKEDVEKDFLHYGDKCPPEEISSLIIQRFKGDPADLLEFVNLCSTLMLLKHKVTVQDIERLFD